MADETKTVEPENLPVEETPEAEGTDEGSGDPVEEAESAEKEEEKKEEGIDNL